MKYVKYTKVQKIKTAPCVNKCHYFIIFAFYKKLKILKCYRDIAKISRQLQSSPPPSPLFSPQKQPFFL